MGEPKLKTVAEVLAEYQLASQTLLHSTLESLQAAPDIREGDEPLLLLTEIGGLAGDTVHRISEAVGDGYADSGFSSREHMMHVLFGIVTDRMVAVSNDLSAGPEGSKNVMYVDESHFAPSTPGQLN